MTFSTRPPSYARPWPVLIVEGVDGGGALPFALALAGSDLFGRAYVVDVRARDAWCDEIGGPFQLVDHDGTAVDVARALTDVMSLPPIEGRPNLLILASGSALWELLRREVDRRSVATFDRGVWNEVTDELWWPWLNLAKGWPGVLVIVAQAHVDELGTYRPDLQKGTPWAVNATVRCSPTESPTIVSANAAQHLVGLSVPSLAAALDMVGHPEDEVVLGQATAKRCLASHARLIHGMTPAAARAAAIDAFDAVSGPDARTVCGVELDAMVATIDESFTGQREEVSDVALTGPPVGERSDGTASPDLPAPTGITTPEGVLAASKEVGLHVSSILDGATDGRTIDLCDITEDDYPAINDVIDRLRAEMAAAGVVPTVSDEPF